MKNKRFIVEWMNNTFDKPSEITYKLFGSLISSTIYNKQKMEEKWKMEEEKYTPDLLSLFNDYFFESTMKFIISAENSDTIDKYTLVINFFRFQ